MNGRRLALVTEELAPWAPGGIGQILAHLIEDTLARSADVSVTVVVPHESVLEEQELKRRYGPRIELRHAERPERGCSPDHAQGLAVMGALAQLEAEGPPLEAVEFADFKGWAFAAVEEKRLRRALGQSRIGVRLHGPASLIAWRERTPVDPWVFELERLALANADVVVAHLGATADAVASFFGFDEAWRARVRVEFPPLGAELRARPERRATRDLVFATKVQAIKRPDLFVLAASRVMRQRPDWRGRAVLAASRASSDAGAALDALIPQEFKHRFVPHTGTRAERRELFAGNVVVVPSDFEAFSLVAWEAAQQGATLVLNERCPAFAAGTPLWSDAGTLRFDGTLDSLAQALERALALEAPPRAPPRPATPWWLAERPAPSPSNAQRASVSVVVLDDGRPAALEATLSSIAASERLPEETLVGCRRGRWPTPRSAGARLVELDLPGEVPEGTAWCELVRAARGELVMALRAGDVPHPRWIGQAVAAFESSDVDAVVPSIDGVPLLGAATMMGLWRPVVGAPGAVWRRRTWLGAREAAPSLESLCWALGLERALGGGSIVASQRLGVRAGGPLVFDAEWVTRQLPMPRPGAVHPMALTGGGWTPPPLRYRIADRVERSVRRALPGSHRALRRVLGRLFR